MIFAQGELDQSLGERIGQDRGQIAAVVTRNEAQPWQDRTGRDQARTEPREPEIAGELLVVEPLASCPFGRSYGTAALFFAVPPFFVLFVV